MATLPSLSSPRPESAASPDGRRTTAELPSPQGAELARELCRVAAHLGSQGLCQGTAGNFSAVVARRPLRLLVTPSGCDKRSLAPGDLLVVGADARPAAASAARPSAEALLHVTVADAVGAGAVLHTHSVPGTLLSEHHLPRGSVTLRGYEMLKGLEGVSTHETEVELPILANSQDMTALSRQVRKLLAGRLRPHGFLLAGHGLYTWGDDLPRAQRHAEILEFLLDCICRRTRFEPYAD